MIDLVLDWFVANRTVLWLFVALMCLVLEMSSPGLFFFLSFFFGALVAAGASLFTISWLAQTIAFVLGTTGAFLLLHYWIKRRSKVFKAHSQTNVYALRNKHGRVLKEIRPDAMGLVKVEGETWSARTLQGQEIKQGAVVKVMRVKGAHLVVEEVKK